MDIAEKLQDPMELVGVAEIAQMAQESKQTIVNWKRRCEDFPAPYAVLAMGSVWRKDEVSRWLAEKKSVRSGHS